jgi:hypothetical protein
MNDKQYTVEQMSKVIALALKANSFMVFEGKSRFFLPAMRVVEFNHEELKSADIIDRLEYILESV